MSTYVGFDEKKLNLNSGEILLTLVHSHHLYCIILQLVYPRITSVIYVFVFSRFHILYYVMNCFIFTQFYFDLLRSFYVFNIWPLSVEMRTVFNKIFNE